MSGPHLLIADDDDNLRSMLAAALRHTGFDVTAACRAALVESLTDDEETVEALMEIVNATFGR